MRRYALQSSLGRRFVGGHNADNGCQARRHTPAREHDLSGHSAAPSAHSTVPVDEPIDGRSFPQNVEEVILGSISPKMSSGSALNSPRRGGPFRGTPNTTNLNRQE